MAAVQVKIYFSGINCKDNQTMQVLNKPTLAKVSQVVYFLQDFSLKFQYKNRIRLNVARVQSIYI